MSLDGTTLNQQRYFPVKDTGTSATITLEAGSAYKIQATTGSKTSRIDYVYCTKPLYDRITYADVIWDEYTTPVRDPQKLSNFWRPSDHMPIMIDFDLK